MSGILGVPPVLAMAGDVFAELVKLGHGDEIVLADKGFPAAGRCKGGKVIYLNSASVAELLQALLIFKRLNPLRYGEGSVFAMAVDKCDFEAFEPGHKELMGVYQELINGRLDADPSGPAEIVMMPRPRFYERAAEASLVIQTQDPAPYANLIISLAG